MAHPRRAARGGGELGQGRRRQVHHSRHVTALQWRQLTPVAVNLALGMAVTRPVRATGMRIVFLP